MIYAAPLYFPLKHAGDFRIAVGASVMVHVTALVILASLAHPFQRPPDPVLQVELVPAQPLPVAPPEVLARAPQPLPQPHVTRAPAKPVESVQRPRLETPIPTAVSEPSEPRVNNEPARAVVPTPSPPVATKPAPAAPAVDTAVASPPSFNAAYLNNPRPVYPRLARRNGEEGTAMLRVLVTRDGLAARVELDKSSGSPILDDAARDAVKGWRFVPARKGSEPVEDWVRVPIVFRLQDG